MSGLSFLFRILNQKYNSPDKNKGDNKAKERFARLGVIASILRDPSKRERYNFFYKNGVPRWRGTGYLYSRFRPGLGSVFIVLSLIAAGMQYIAGQINYRQEKKRILQFIADARAQMILEAPKGRAATLGRSVIEVGHRAMRCEVKSDNYIIVYPDGNVNDPVHLNTEWVAQPTFRDLFIIKWPRRVIYKILNKKEEEEVVEEVYEEEEAVEEENKATTDSPKNSKKLRKRGGGEKVNVIGSKVGGRRRAVRN